ncbi:outer membrane protein assembly factor [Desulfoprunum benzoelyticum]|uniref:Translocation and assembly module TamA n=1 Tax=Desulfoprunum benzoelyticum TaxID=1506996 RepID=A0A840UV06_9BACT|nr:autotransporter assembly complex family protein [Desulfoprunum benzoelyticum]MBB5348663.1 translocation and assembly module TamA [Desulfoprunum benzoelyticum]MBM9530058.1 outer membrane protein assembly factor [Desulfoprunum benzoelyticum]
MTGQPGHNAIVRSKRLPLLLLLVCAAALAGCSSRGIDLRLGLGDEKERAVAGDSVPTIPYQVKLTGVDPQEKDLLAALEETSTSLRLRDRPPPTLAGLNRRAEDDIERFAAVLRSFGFYDGRVASALRNTPAGNGETGWAEAATTPSDKGRDTMPQPVTLEFLIETGPPYRLARADLLLTGPDGTTASHPLDNKELQKVGLSSGMRAEADPIIQAGRRLVDRFHHDDYPLAKAGNRTVIADSAAKTLSVTYGVVTGREARFGAVTVSGAEKVDADFIAGYRTWPEGGQFSPAEIAATRRELAKSKLFDAASVDLGGPVNDQGEIPITMQVSESAHRTVGGGIEYSTADGIGGNGFWEHRNLFGSAERLRLRLAASQLQQGAEAGFSKPRFFQRRQSLVVDGQGKQYNTAAYEGQLADSFVGVERRFAQYWTATAGLTAEYSSLTGADSPNEDFYLGGMRASIRRDSTSNPLDPTSGSRLEMTVSPLTSLGGASTRFISAGVNGSSYLPFDRAGHYVVAGRARLAGVWGEERSALPAHKRYYSGGGGSVRGYEYQKIGPLDENHDPIGGRSVVETGLELRARVSEHIGVVPFVEGGNVFDDSQPSSLDLRWAAGLGLRYYTAIGPLRLDFALPLDKREGSDDDFQIYLSIGQAF